MHKLYLDCMTKENDRIRLKFNLLKQSRPPVKSPIMELCAYPENPKICVVKTLSHYLERTQSFRKQETKLFLTYQKPHRAVSASTISRWIKSMLKRAGVDTSKFGAHSTRAASSSAAKQAGVPIMDILSTGDGPQNAPLLGTIVYLFKRKIILLKLLVTLTRSRV